MRNLFKKPTTSKAVSAPTVPTGMVVQAGHHHLALGLKWQAIVLQGQAAPDTAAKAKATHYTTAPNSVGYARFAKDTQALLAAGRVHSAALLATQVAPSAQAVIALSLGPANDTTASIWWARIDQGRTLEDAVVDAADWSGKLQALGSHPQTTVYTDHVGVQTACAHQGLEHTAYTWDDVANLAASNQASRIQAVPSQMIWARLPMPLRWAGAGLAIYFLASSAWDHYEDQARIAAQQALRAASEQSDNEALQSLLRQYQSQLQTLAVEREPLNLSTRFADLPLLLDGWPLKLVQCQAQSVHGSADQAVRPWTCSAEYSIPAEGTSYATYEQIEAGQSVPIWATLIRQPARQLKLQFDLRTEVQPMDDEWRSIEEHHLGIVSALQASLPRLAQLQDIRFETMPLNLSARRTDGTALALPGTVLNPQKATVQLAADLATVDKEAAAWPPDVAWQRITISPQGGKISADSLMVTLEGALYAR